MKNKKFTFEISIQAIPFNKETTEEIYGKGAYEEGKFGVQAHAADVVFTCLNDAYCQTLIDITKHLGECKCETKDMTDAQKRYHKYLKAKSKHAKEIVDSLKFIRVE